MINRNLTILIIFICAVLCSAGCVTAAKNLAKPAPIQTMIPTPTINQTPDSIPPANISHQVVYVEGQDEYMFRTGGHWLGDWVQYKRENVEGKKDLDLRVTVYRTLFLPNYYYWSVNWGKYFIQAPSEGNKYLVIFVRAYINGTTQESDPRIWGPGPEHFTVQTADNITTLNTNRLPGSRIKELEEYRDMKNVSRVYDYGYYRYYDRDGREAAGELGYIRMGESNAWDGFIIYEVPQRATAKDLMVLARIDGIGNVWWYLTPKPL